MKIENNHIYNMDCIEGMKNIPDKSIDCIICDLPYETTKCKWDNIIPFDDLWAEYKRIIKDNGAILLFGTEPFSSSVRMSNLKWYRYDWYWHKSMCSNFLNGKKQPFFKVETVSVFYKKSPVYNPQMEEGKPYAARNDTITGTQQQYGLVAHIAPQNFGTRYPDNVIEFSNGNNHNIHPTQKPVALIEYLIKTYTNENDVILDNCMGSGTTAIACINTNRQYIGFELEKEYYDLCIDRINKSKED